MTVTIEIRTALAWRGEPASPSQPPSKGGFDLPTQSGAGKQRILSRGAKGVRASLPVAQSVVPRRLLGSNIQILAPIQNPPSSLPHRNFSHPASPAMVPTTLRMTATAGEGTVPKPVLVNARAQRNSGEAHNLCGLSSQHKGPVAPDHWSAHLTSDTP